MMQKLFTVLIITAHIIPNAAMHVYVKVWFDMII